MSCKKREKIPDFTGIEELKFYADSTNSNDVSGKTIVIGAENIKGSAVAEAIKTLEENRCNVVVINTPEIAKFNNTETIQRLKVLEDFRYSHLTKKERDTEISSVRTKPKTGRNDLCPCGSGKKYKHCCSKNSNLFNKLNN